MLFKCLRLQHSILDSVQHPPPLKYLGCDSNRAQRKSHSAHEYGISSLIVMSNESFRCCFFVENEQAMLFLKISQNLAILKTFIKLLQQLTFLNRFILSDFYYYDKI